MLTGSHSTNDEESVFKYCRLLSRGGDQGQEEGHDLISHGMDILAEFADDTLSSL
jgi:hypothetical protein